MTRTEENAKNLESVLQILGPSRTIYDLAHRVNGSVGGLSARSGRLWSVRGRLDGRVKSVCSRVYSILGGVTCVGFDGSVSESSIIYK